MPGGIGGGIYNAGQAQLVDCRIELNSSGRGAVADFEGYGSEGGSAGGIYNGGLMSLINCTVISNLAGAGGVGAAFRVSEMSEEPPGGGGGQGGYGAGIFNAGQLDMAYCTVANNVAGDGGNGGSGSSGGNGGWGGSGGGIFNYGRLDLNACTISGNICGNGGTGGNGSYDTGGSGGSGGGGGGIINFGVLNATACTIVLNQAGIGRSAGNGIYPYGQDYIFDTEILVAGGDGGSGGGILNVPSQYPSYYQTNVVIRDSLIALNIPNLGGFKGTDWVDSVHAYIGRPGTMGTGYEIYGQFISQGFNLISTGDGGTGFTNGLNSDQVGTDANPINPVLGPLQWNGGPTPTHALLPGSPAINQGYDFGLHADQRGYPRPYPYPGIPNAPNGDGSDIGAFELQGH